MIVPQYFYPFLTLYNPLPAAEFLLGTLWLHWRNWCVVDNVAVYETPPASPTAQQVQTLGTSLGQPKSGYEGGMEGDEQRRRQYEQFNQPRGYVPDYGAQEPMVPNLQNYRGQVSDNADRFREGQLLSSRIPTSTPLPAGAGNMPDMGAFAYGQGPQYQQPMQPPPINYQSEYLQDAQRQRSPPYPSQVYNTSQQPPPQSPYNAPQQPHQQSPYDPTGQFQRRHMATVGNMPPQYGLPQQYYSISEAPSASAPTGISHSYHTAPFPQPAQYSTLGRSTLASPYPPTPVDLSQPGSTGEDLEREPDEAALNNDRFYRAIGETNSFTSRGMLVHAADNLMKLSDWLLTHAISLDLGRDDQAMHQQKLALWNNFNDCWLALLQRQLDETQRMLETGLPPAEILPAEDLEKMGDNLERHCDELAKFGLVDYEMGVAEEHIEEMLERCLDLLKTDADDRGQPGGGSAATMPIQRRGNR